MKIKKPTPAFVAKLSMHALDEAIFKAGGVSKLARKIGVTQQVVSNWRCRKSLPPEQVLNIEAIMDVSRHRLRCDYYPEEP